MESALSERGFQKVKRIGLVLRGYRCRCRYRYGCGYGGDVPSQAIASWLHCKVNMDCNLGRSFSLQEEDHFEVR